MGTVDFGIFLDLRHGIFIEDWESAQFQEPGSALAGNEGIRGEAPSRGPIDLLRTLHSKNVILSPTGVCILSEMIVHG